MPFLVNSKWKIVNRKKSIHHSLSTIHRPAFSLIELLIVIALIGILSAIVSNGIISSQRKARDSQRKSDLAQVKRALQSAKNDCKSSAYHPILTPSTVTEVNQFSDGATPSTNSLMGYLSNANLKYISSIFKDPRNTGNYQYRYAFATSTASVCPDAAAAVGLNTSGSTDYVLRVALEDTRDPSLKTSYAKCSPKFSNSSPAGPITLNPASTDSPADGIDDLFFYYECSD